MASTMASDKKRCGPLTLQLKKNVAEMLRSALVRRLVRLARISTRDLTMETLTSKTENASANFENMKTRNGIYEPMEIQLGQKGNSLCNSCVFRNP